ncbi:MAG TPA: iron ABC transporter permease [Pseudomonadota bacterium]|nr:iron ABC transporter permease [Pseudomonadota bacterium]
MTRRRWVVPALLIGLLATAVLCASLGALRIPLLCFFASRLPDSLAVTCPDPALLGAILMLRLPRVVLGLAVGAGLGLAGAVLQGLFRNPLVDPGLVGVASGSALAASAAMVLGGSAWNTPPVLTAASFLGGLAAAASVQGLSRAGGRTIILSLLLAGVAINAITGALLGLLSYLATDSQLRNLAFWSLGSLGGATWPRALWALSLTALGGVSLLRLARPLNLLLLGEAEAEHLGVPVEAVKLRALLLCVLLVASSVALCGVIGFVGLVVPHLVRLLGGPNHRVVLPGSAILGAGLLLWADLLSRLAVAPAELPIGIVTASLGGPFFLGLLLRERQKWGS